MTSTQPTSPTRGRYALRWVLGVGLVFVVVIGSALWEARSAADEMWDNVVAQWDEEWPFDGLRETSSRARVGSIFREWREGRCDKYGVVLLQERSMFGSRIEARMGEAPWRGPAFLGYVRGTFAEVGIELTVEP